MSSADDHTPRGIGEAGFSVGFDDAAATIVLADRRPSVRAATRRALERHGFETLGQASSADEAVALSLEHRPQAVLLDMDLPGTLAAIEELKDELPRIRIAVLTGSRADGDVVRTMRAGADGYILKASAPDRVAAALRALMRGEIVLPRALTGALVAELRKSTAADRSRSSHGLPKIARRLRRSGRY